VNRRQAKSTAKWSSAASHRLLELAGHPADMASAVAIVAERFMEGVPCPPTDLEALGPALNVHRFVAEPMPISGELRRESDGFVVAYSTFLSDGRRRFTIAHELGHAIFETTGPNCPRAGEELERLCDMLASELLMPRRVFLAHCGSPLEITLPRFFGLADSFQASITATALRCAQLIGLTIFEADGANINWAFGAIRKGPVGKLHSDLRDVIEKVRQGESHEELMYFPSETTGYQWWKVQTKKVGNERKALVLLVPMGRRLGGDALE
jgi:IrrE N-terminal-like domain